MFNFLSDKPILKIFSFVLLVTLATSLVNINYEVQNYKLHRSIDELEEEKAIMRAQYLSDTSFSRLDYKATALKMASISDKNCAKLSKAEQRNKFLKLQENFLSSHHESFDKPSQYLNGF